MIRLIHERDVNPRFTGDNNNHPGAHMTSDLIANVLATYCRQR